MVNRFTMAQSTAAMRRWGPPAIVTLAAVAAVTALTGAATARQARPAAPTEATAPRQAGEPIMAIVSIKSQQVTFYDADGWILRAPVSTGTTGRETPAGVFAVVEKDKDHRSTMYDDAEMPNMQRITWNGIALHGGPLPGYAASRACFGRPLTDVPGEPALVALSGRVVPVTLQPDLALAGWWASSYLCRKGLDAKPTARLLAAAEAGRHGVERSGSLASDALTSMPSSSADAKSGPRAEIMRRSGHGDRTHYIRHHHD